MWYEVEGNDQHVHHRAMPIRVCQNSKIISDHLATWVHFFGDILDIVDPKHTKRTKWSEILLFFETP